MNVSPWTLSASRLMASQRVDSEFFDPRVDSVSAALKAAGARPLGTLVASASRGVTPKYVTADEVPVVKTANVRRYALASEPRQFVSKCFADENLRATVSAGDIVITSTGVGSAGRTFLKLDNELMLADTHITILRTDDAADAAFLCAFLQSPIGVQQLLRLRRGSSRQIEIYPEDILTLLVPQVDRQTRVAISERWIDSVRAVQSSAAATSEAEEQIASWLSSRSINGRSDQKTWALPIATLTAGRRIDAEYCIPEVERLRGEISRAGAVQLADLILEARKGLQPQAYVEGGCVHVIKSKDVHYPELDLSLCDTTTEDDWPYFLSGNEMLINMTGIGTLGRATVVPKAATDAMALIPAVDVMAIKVDPSMALPQYVALYLNSQIGRRLTSSLQTGSSGQQHLYPAHFSEIPVLLPRTRSGKPDLAWQRRIIEVAERRNMALESARASGRELDAVFLEELGVPVDMSIVPV